MFQLWSPDEQITSVHFRRVTVQRSYLDSTMRPDFHHSIGAARHNAAVLKMTNDHQQLHQCDTDNNMLPSLVKVLSRDNWQSCIVNRQICTISATFDFISTISDLLLVKTAIIQSDFPMQKSLARHFYANTRWWEALCFQAVRPAVRPLSVNIYFAWYLHTQLRDFNETWHKYSSCEWVTTEKVYKVRGQRSRL